MDKNFEIESRNSFKHAMSLFDFKNVLSVMKFTNWTWINPNGEQIPSIKEMKVLVENLFINILKEFKEENTWIESGGFRVEINRFGWVRILFILEEAE